MSDRKFLTERVIGPACPRCHKQTEKRTRQADGHAFFGCVAYPKCRGTLDAEAVEPLPHSNVIDLAARRSPAEREAIRRAEVHRRLEEIVQRNLALAARLEDVIERRRRARSLAE